MTSARRPSHNRPWRGGSRQYRLAEFVRQCRVFLDITEDDYRRAGWMPGKAALPPKKRPDAVDALVVVTAVLHRASVIVTSDPEDISAYATSLDLKLDVVRV